MFTEICLAIIALALVALIFTLLKISSQVQKSISLIQTDIQVVSKETVRLLNTMNEFVQADLHEVSEETRQLIGQLKDLSSDIKNKSYSLNVLFKPLSFLSSKLGEGPSLDESASNPKIIPQILKWITSSALLFNKIKEFKKSHEK